MRFYQRGQTMAEYMVVAVTLFGALYWATTAECPGYHTCIDKLKTVMHDKYEGYSHSISAVHQYGDFEGEGFESTWDDGVVDTPDDGGSGSSEEEETADGLSSSNQLLSSDGSTVYGSISGSETLYDEDGNPVGYVQYVVDGEGNVIGTYDPDTGVITLNDGTTDNALAATVVTDEEGNVVPMQAVVDCSTGEVYGFGYESGVTGNFHNTVTLAEMDIDGYCKEETYAVYDDDNKAVAGAVVGGLFYSNTYTMEIGPALEASGEVVYFDIEVPDETVFESTDPTVGEQVEACAVMKATWDDSAGSDRDRLEIYLTDSDKKLGNVVSSYSCSSSANSSVTD